MSLPQACLQLGAMIFRCTTINTADTDDLFRQPTLIALGHRVCQYTLARALLAWSLVRPSCVQTESREMLTLVVRGRKA